jgi:hypothetical protein
MFTRFINCDACKILHGFHQMSTFNPSCIYEVLMRFILMKEGSKLEDFNVLYEHEVIGEPQERINYGIYHHMK